MSIRPYQLRMTPPVTVEVKYGKVIDDRPQKLDYFEVVDRQKKRHDEPFQRIEEVHKELEKKQPKEIPIRLLSDDIEESFSLFRAMFNNKGQLWCGAQYGDDKAKRRFREHENGNIEFPVEEYDVDCNEECPFWQNGDCDLTGALYFQLDEDLPRSNDLAVLRAKGTYAQKQIKSSLSYISKITGGVLANMPLKLRLHKEPKAQNNNYPIPVITVKTRFPARQAEKYAAKEMERRRNLKKKRGEEVGGPEDLRRTGILTDVIGRQAAADMRKVDNDVDDDGEIHEVDEGLEVKEIPDDIEEMMDDLGFRENKKQMIFDRFGGNREKIVNHLEQEKQKQDEIPDMASEEDGEESQPEVEEDPFGDIEEDFDDDFGEDIEPDMFDIDE